MDSTEASLDKAPFHCQGEGKRGRDVGVGDVPMCDLEEQDNDTVRKEQGRGASRVPALTTPMGLDDCPWPLVTLSCSEHHWA